MKYFLLILVLSFSLFSSSLLAKDGEGEAKPILQFAPYWGHTTPLDSMVLEQRSDKFYGWYIADYLSKEVYVFDREGRMTKWYKEDRDRNKPDEIAYSYRYSLTYDDKTMAIKKVSREWNYHRGKDMMLRKEFLVSDSSYIGDRTFKLMMASDDEYLKVKISENNLLESFMWYMMSDDQKWNLIYDYTYVFDKKTHLPVASVKFDLNKKAYQYDVFYEYVVFDKNKNWTKRYLYQPKLKAAVEKPKNGVYINYKTTERFYQQFRKLYYRK